MWCSMSSPMPRTWRGGSSDASRLARGQRGVALPGVLVFAAVLVGITGWLLGHVRVDAFLGRMSSADQQAVRLAEGAAALVAMSLGAASDWAPVSSLGAAPACPAASAPVVPADAASERAWAQAETDASSRWGAETPQWQLAWHCHAAAVLGRWPGPGSVPVVLVWVADEPEGDGQPLVSTNQRLLVRALALGAGGMRGVVTGTIERAAPGAPVTLASWRPRSVG